MKDNICRWICAWLIPKRLVFHCAIEVLAYATTGKYSDEITTEILGVTALKRYYDDLIR